MNKEKDMDIDFDDVEVGYVEQAGPYHRAAADRKRARPHQADQVWDGFCAAFFFFCTRY
jgi:hypothetical protein